VQDFESCFFLVYYIFIFILNLSFLKSANLLEDLARDKLQIWKQDFSLTVFKTIHLFKEFCEYTAHYLNA